MAKFPFYRQLDKGSCGIACIRVICKYYGKTFTEKYLAENSNRSKDGLSLLDISDIAESLGLRTAGVVITFEQLRSQAVLPCIINWNQNHFVVVYKIKKIGNITKIYISDSAQGLLVYKKESFLKCWPKLENDEWSESMPKFHSGIALLLEPTPEFYEKDPEQRKKTISFGYLFRYIKPYKKYIFQLLLSVIAGSLISLVFPFLTQAVVDKGIGSLDIHYVTVILFAQIALIIGQTSNNFVRSWLMLHITARIGITLMSVFLNKLLKLPLSFFESRKVGDILQRVGDYDRIQIFLTGSLLSISIAFVTFIIYGTVMASYNLTILIIFLIGSILHILWVLRFLKRRRKLDYMRFQEAAIKNSNMIHLINGMSDIRLNNAEKQKRWEWEDIEARIFKISIKGLTLGQFQEAGGVLIDQTKNIIMSFIAATLVISGDITLGMMVAIQYIIGQLNAPLSQVIQFTQSIQDAKISLERLDQIHSIPDEEPNRSSKIKEIPKNQDLIFTNVCFRYGGINSEMVLKNINITIPTKKITAIVGTSGSGKTTLIKLLLGFYLPTKGEILISKRPIQEYDLTNWRRKCSIVMQDGYIFPDTIANNIGLSSNTPDIKAVEKLLTMTNLADFVQSLPMGVHTLIGEDGHGLSKGQIQRLLIARALYKNSDYLFLDEATNCLDANNECILMDNLNKIFKDKTVIIIAHRLSTVKNADNIIVLEKGDIVESGTHEELIRNKKFYYQLVKNQLELGD